MKNIIDKTIIGTAQLFSSYGISNFEKDKKNKNKAIKFLNFCIKSGFKKFDTAPGYRNELLLSKFIKNKKNFKITTKIPSFYKHTPQKKFKVIESSIKNSYLKFEQNLETILFHDQNDVNFVLNNFNYIKNIFAFYKVPNYGFSIYDIKKLNIIKKKVKNDKITLQVPINFVDDRFLKVRYPSNYSICGRSIFLQGLLINKNIKKKLNKKNTLLHQNYFEYLESYSINPYKICISSTRNPKINNFTVGFDNIYQVRQFIKKDNKIDFSNHKTKIKKIFSNKNILDPRKW